MGIVSVKMVWGMCILFYLIPSTFLYDYSFLTILYSSRSPRDLLLAYPNKINPPSNHPTFIPSLAQGFALPNRQFYTPATDYKNVPSELGLRPIPSHINLPEHFEMQTNADMYMRTRASGLGQLGGMELRVRGGRLHGNGNGNGNE